MNKNTIWTIVAVAVIAIAGIWLFAGKNNSVNNTAANNSQSAAATATAVTPAPDTAATTSTPAVTAPSAVTINVEGGMFYFNPKEIRVKKGQTVTIHFTNKTGTHNWVIDAFNARTPLINGGQSANVTFIASKTGSFEYYCSVGNHRAQGMKGTLIVE